ncbi:MAG: DNA polymerase III subunit gamma/tau [Acidobacteriota bacterium]
MEQTGSHQALARRYRPRTFEEMVGQEAVVRTLKNALSSGKVHPAYIFSGIRGVGKTTAARIFSKGLNCHAFSAPTPEPCNACPSCEEIARGGSLDVLEIDGATHTKAEEARDLMQVARYMPARDRFKVFIIDEVHMLSTAAFNALLKTLEEPPPHVVFILATTEPHKIPETIHSRAQHFQFRRVPENRILRFLKELCTRAAIEAEPQALELVARAGDGSVRDSLTLLDRLLAYADGPLTEAETSEVLGVVGREALFALLEAVLAGDAAGAVAFVDQLRERGQDLGRFLEDFDRVVRRAVRVRLEAEPGEVPPRLLKIAAGASLEDLLRLSDLVASTRQRLAGSPDPEALVELQLVKAAHLPRILPLELLLSQRPPAAILQTPGGGLPKAPSGGEEGGFRFTGLIPFKRMEEGEAASLAGSDPRVQEFRRRASSKLPLAGSFLEAASVSLDPDGVLHLALPEGARAAQALLASEESLRSLREAAREAGYPGPVAVESREEDPEPRAPRAESPRYGPAVEKIVRRMGGQVVDVRPLSPEPPAPGGDDAEPE